MFIAALLAGYESIFANMLTTIGQIRASAFTRGIIDFLIMGRVPGTDIVIEFEAFFIGMITAMWAIITYGLTLRAASVLFETFSDDNGKRTAALEEVAL